MVKKSLVLYSSIISFGLFFVDQMIKGLVSFYKPSIDFYFVSFHHVLNTGASFGMLQNNNTLFIWLSFIVIGVFLYFYDKFPATTYPWLILAGGGVVSNLADRIFRGAVVDYIDLGWFPVFNIADNMIVVSVFVIILFHSKEKD